MTEVTYFERLDVPECLHLLRTGGVGRVAWQDNAEGLTVLPVNYRVIGDSVVFRTSAASTLARLAKPRWMKSTMPLRSDGRCWSVE